MEVGFVGLGNMGAVLAANLVVSGFDVVAQDAAGIAYVDAPVSGGVAGARARTLAVMYAGEDDACSRVDPVLAGLSDRRRRMAKDLALYRDEVETRDRPAALGRVIEALWARFAAAEPGVDFTRIYPFVEGG